MDKALQKAAALLGDESLTAARVNWFEDGAYTKKPAFGKENDLKGEFYGESGVTLADFSAGYAFSLPETNFKIDYTIAKFHTKISFGDTVITASGEESNPYYDRPHTWFIYGDEWLMRHLFSDKLMQNCNIKRLRSPKHPLTKEEPYGDLDVKEGYDVYQFSFLIEGEVEYPYYDIAVVRRQDDEVRFSLFVIKSKQSRSALADFIVQSLVRFSPVGVRKNYFDAGEPKGNPHWNDETKAYFQKLSSADRVEWGVFSYSMPGLEEDLTEESETYRLFLRKSIEMQEVIEKAWRRPFDIYPTYTHIGKGTDSAHYQTHSFPSAMAERLAGGNGFNGKPVLQFTYQFTLNNNLVFEDETPMFDILRGKYDGQFRRLARDIKAYRKPVLFRLNNEMNTDWTSYCGMMTLLDPDIFNETWIRLYRIFEEEGVDNCIWIWNPIATSCPYSSWGEDLCYFPGVDYVQLLGGTSYEMNNYAKEEAQEKVVTFKTHYERLYNKNKEAFARWSLVISEFACGSGGDLTGELARNRSVQAKWVKDMFQDLTAKNKPEWVKQLKGAIWFNCNDVAEGKVMNRLRFIDPENDPDNETVQAFGEGFAKERE